jgi:hypothetical protein
MWHPYLDFRFRACNEHGSKSTLEFSPCPLDAQISNRVKLMGLHENVNNLIICSNNTSL